MSDKTVYIITGPTATGKSLIAYHLAKSINGEIVNCDSIQLYKYMDIGSAKPSENDMKRIPHHLFSIADPAQPITVAKYRELAISTIDDILSRGRTPIVCGGTGLYLNSILYEMNFANAPSDDERREELEQMAEENGNDYMYQFLQGLDPDAASRIHPNNIRKIIRAIEAYEHGRGIKDLSYVKLNPDYDFKFYALNMDREWLYERINSRVNKLINDGLIDEVRHLVIDKAYDTELSSMKGIGYKELTAYLRGECDLDTAVSEIKKNTRHYAKRQITWLKRYDFANWIMINKGDKLGDILGQITGDAKEGDNPNG